MRKGHKRKLNAKVNHVFELWFLRGSFDILRLHEIKLVNPEGNQFWILIETDAKAFRSSTPLCHRCEVNWLIRKDPWWWKDEVRGKKTRQDDYMVPTWIDVSLRNRSWGALGRLMYYTMGLQSQRTEQNRTDLPFVRKAITNLEALTKSRDTCLLTKVCLVVYFSCSHVWMSWPKEVRALKNWWFWTWKLKTKKHTCRSNQSILKQINWISLERPDAGWSSACWVLMPRRPYWKDPDAGRDLRQEKNAGMTEERSWDGIIDPVDELKEIQETAVIGEEVWEHAKPQQTKNGIHLVITETGKAEKTSANCSLSLPYFKLLILLYWENELARHILRGHKMLWDCTQILNLDSFFDYRANASSKEFLSSWGSGETIWIKFTIYHLHHWLSKCWCFSCHPLFGLFLIYLDSMNLMFQLPCNIVL